MQKKMRRVNNEIVPVLLCADDLDRTQLASPRSHPLRAAVNVQQMNCLFLELSISYFWTPHLIMCD